MTKREEALLEKAKEVIRWYNDESYRSHTDGPVWSLLDTIKPYDPIFHKAQHY